MKKTLMAPSTYKRVGAEYTEASPLTFAEFVDYQETKGCPMADFGRDACIMGNEGALKYGSTVDWTKPGAMDRIRPYSGKNREKYLKHLFEEYERKPESERQTAFVKIEYDAVNAYNAPLRSTHICRFGPRGGGDYRKEDMFEVQSLDGAS